MLMVFMMIMMMMIIIIPVIIILGARTQAYIQVQYCDDVILITSSYILNNNYDKHFCD